MVASNSRTRGPVVSQPDGSTATTASLSGAPLLGAENGMNAAAVVGALLTDGLPIRGLDVPRVRGRDDGRPRQRRAQCRAYAQHAMRRSEREGGGDGEPIASGGLGAHAVAVDACRPRQAPETGDGIDVTVAQPGVAERGFDLHQ